MMVINMFLWNIQLNRLLVEDGLSLFTCLGFSSEAGCDGEVSRPGPLLWKWVSAITPQYAPYKIDLMFGGKRFNQDVPPMI